VAKKTPHAVARVAPSSAASPLTAPAASHGAVQHRGARVRADEAAVEGPLEEQDEEQRVDDHP
jgi:hypothetical protein